MLGAQRAVLAPTNFTSSVRETPALVRVHGLWTTSTFGRI